ncbi:hypothetical protein BH09MYX1_BH09MYX1_66720 [soil metagenome]
MNVARLGLPFACPIPVGHRVELRHFARNTGVFSEDWQPQPWPAVVVDLDTGVHYMSDSILQGSALALGAITIDPSVTSPQVRPMSGAQGRVQSVHVISHASGQNFQIVTMLVVTIDEGAPGYR